MSIIYGSKRSILTAIFLSCTLLKVVGQTNTDSLPTPAVALKPVEISAARLTHTELDAPLAVAVLNKSRLQLATQQLSPYEVLGAVPGVFAMNPDNFSQDLRISIRGFGARSAFGIRGIRVFTDGLPEGTPDGQVDVDNLDMGIIQQMEVLRGAAAGLYGNAAGGVIYLTTESPTNNNLLLEAQRSIGAYGFDRYQVKAGKQFGPLSFLINASQNKTEGFRQWSEMKSTLLNAKLAWQLNPGAKLTLLANYGDSPIAHDPGALTTEQAASDPRQAGANNLLFETGEAVTQYRVGLTYDHRLAPKHLLQARVFHTARHLENRLAIAANGFGDLKRQYQGAYLNYQFDAKPGNMPYRLKVGIDIENQADTRLRYAYDLTVVDSVSKYIQGDNVLNQEESFQSTGVYLLQNIRPFAKLLVSVGVRFDQLNLNVSDRFLSDGDQSGERRFQKVNPTLGLNYALTNQAALYANYSTSFESPTLNELSNNPDGSGGFNSGLAPQTARSVEIGGKGRLAFSNPDKGLQFDVAVFQIETENDVTPYQLDGQPGKTYFRNAGKTSRTGVELGLNMPLTAHLQVYFTQTISQFRYKTYQVNSLVYDGNRLPGIPKLHSQLELRYERPRGLFGWVQVRQVGRVYANDANSAIAPAYTLANLRLGYHLQLKRYLWIEPFAGANNLTDVRYMANVQLNAGGERYFEPGTGRYWLAGVKFRI